MSDSYDVIIKGAGLAGWALAAIVAKLGVSCLLVGDEKTDVPHVQDRRPISLSYASVEILKTLGVFSYLQANCRPIMQVEVSQQGLGTMREEEFTVTQPRSMLLKVLGISQKTEQ